MSGARDGDEGLGFVGEFEQSSRQFDWDNEILVAMDEEDGGIHLADREIRAIPILQIPARRKHPVMRGGDVDCRKIGRVENDSGGLVRASKEYREARPKNSPIRTMRPSAYPHARAAQ